jgi:hypothetical protein
MAKVRMMPSVNSFFIFVLLWQCKNRCYADRSEREGQLIAYLVDYLLLMLKNLPFLLILADVRLPGFSKIFLHESFHFSKIYCILLQIYIPYNQPTSSSKARRNEREKICSTSNYRFLIWIFTSRIYEKVLALRG